MQACDAAAFHHERPAHMHLGFSLIATFHRLFHREMRIAAPSNDDKKVS